MKKINKALMMILLMANFLTIGMMVENDVNINSHQSQEEWQEEITPRVLAPVINKLEVARPEIEEEHYTNNVDVIIEFEANGILTKDSYIEIQKMDGISIRKSKNVSLNWVSGSRVWFYSILLYLDTEYKLEASLINEYGTSQLYETTFILPSLNSLELEQTPDNKIKINYDSDVVNINFELFEEGNANPVDRWTSQYESVGFHTFNYITKLNTKYTVIAEHEELEGNITTKTLTVLPWKQPIVEIVLTPTHNPFGTSASGKIKVDLNIEQWGFNQVETIAIKINEELWTSINGSWDSSILDFKTTHEFIGLDNGIYKIQVKLSLDSNSEQTELISPIQEIEITTNPEVVPPTDPEVVPPTNEDETLNGGIIAGIVIGSIAGVALIGTGSYFLIKKYN